MINQYAHTYANGAVSNIKCRPMIIADKKIEEIHDFFVMDAVNQIADRSTENHNQTVVNSLFIQRCLMIDHQYGNNRKGRNSNKYQGFVFQLNAGKESKCYPWVADMREIEKIFDNRGGIV